MLEDSLLYSRTKKELVEITKTMFSVSEREREKNLTFVFQTLDFNPISTFKVVHVHTRAYSQHHHHKRHKSNIYSRHLYEKGEAREREEEK